MAGSSGPHDAGQHRDVSQRQPAIDPQDIRTAVFALLDERAGDATVCPSEVARRLTAGAAGWRSLMPQVREVAAELARRGALRVTRGGVVVDALSGSGPIRLGRPSKPFGRPSKDSAG